MSMFPLLIVALIFVVFGALPAWPFHRSWQYRSAQWPGVFLAIAAAALFLSHP
ncbi:MAG TPA: DUF3309 family protein [Candidatus Didemnitutus sp.]|nr:DUF3309 family protein [Candidatus Didemnitutus sp.]